MVNPATETSNSAVDRIQRVISPEVAEPPPGLWSNCLRVEDQVFISGMVALNGSEVVGEDDPYAQAVFVFQNLQHLMESAGGNVSGIVSLTIYVTDMRHRPSVLEARRQFFKGDFPCSTLVEVSALIDPKLLVEINAVGFV